MSAQRRSDDLERVRGQWAHRGGGRPSWAIEPGPGQESVWDYPRPPRLDSDSRQVRVVFMNMVIAETRRSIRVLETASPPTFYIPRDDVRTDLLTPGRGASHCEWKGEASYWSLRVAPNEIANVAWSYEDPYPEFKMIQGHLAFYPSKVQCYVDGGRVAPQPGGFYGGWVTEEIVGPFKGEPGTGGW